MLTNAEYSTVTATPFVPPLYPAKLTITAGMDQVQALNLREIHIEGENVYYECKNVKKDLQRHVQDAVEGKYLESLVDEDTQLI